jgi:hypothetical protein
VKTRAQGRREEGEQERCAWLEEARLKITDMLLKKEYLIIK